MLSVGKSQGDRELTSKEHEGVKVIDFTDMPDPGLDLDRFRGGNASQRSGSENLLPSGKLRYTSGDVVHPLHYHPNGSTQEFNDDASVNKGKWKLRGDRSCTIWPSRKNWECFGVVRLDDGRFGDVEDGTVTGYVSR